ncbi:MAG: metallophosphoesterase [Oscillospiraceae bacterium]|nr:metallophosphoesterase [Oscillospiraceae bacterium]
MLKIVHCADVHLDSPFSLNDPRNAGAELRRLDLRSSFISLIKHAKNYGARLFLISGDLFDEKYVSRDTVNFIVKEMSSYPDCRFFIAPGEADPYSSKSPYKLMKWSDNVHIFKSGDLTKIEIPEFNADIYGYAFTGEAIDPNPFGNKKPQNQNRINILVGHGEVLITPEEIRKGSNICPIKASDIQNSGFDYIALGHLHNGTGVREVGGTFFSYPGCLFGRGFDEPGHKGAMCGEIDKGKCELKGVKFSTKRYVTIQVDISQYITENQIAEALRLAAVEYGDDTALRVELTGVQRPDLDFSLSEIEKRFTQFYFLQVKNKTVPYTDENILKFDKTVRGIFYKRLEPKLNSKNEKERAEAQLALQYVFNAFAGMNIGDL